MKPIRRLLVPVAAFAVVLLIVATIAVVARRISPPFDLALIQQLRYGMTEEEVQALLGPPTSKKRLVWIYASPGSWPRVIVDFNSNGEYARCNYNFF